MGKKKRPSKDDLESGKGNETEGSNGQGVGEVDVGSGGLVGGGGGGGGRGGAVGLGSTALEHGSQWGDAILGLLNIGSVADGGSAGDTSTNGTGGLPALLGPVAETVLVGGLLDQDVQQGNVGGVVDGKDVDEVLGLLGGELGALGVLGEGSEDTLGAGVVGELLGADGSDSDGGDDEGLDLHVGSCVFGGGWEWQGGLSVEKRRKIKWGVLNGIYTIDLVFVGQVRSGKVWFG